MYNDVCCSTVTYAKENTKQAIMINQSYTVGIQQRFLEFRYLTDTINREYCTVVFYLNGDSMTRGSEFFTTLFGLRT